jgi:hypothetical protein
MLWIEVPKQEVGFLNCGMKKPRIVIRKCGESFYRMTWNGEEECMVHMAVQWQIARQATATDILYF